MRRDNWAEGLAEYLAEAAKRTFEQGQFDCGHFVADAVFTMTGVDHYGEFRGKYQSVRGYMSLLAGLGYASVEEYLDDNFERHGALATVRRGDIVMRIEGELEALGICDGRQSLFINVDGGLASVPTMACMAGWRVD